MAREAATRVAVGQIYVYGIVNNGQGSSLGVAGVDGASPVRIVAGSSLGCVVSDYRGEPFEALSKEKLVRSLLAHQQVLEQVMRSRPVLPVKFGTLLAGSQEVQDLLSMGCSAFADLLSFLQDKVELEVAATWDTNRLLQEVSKEEEIVKAREALRQEPGGQTLEQRISLGRMVQGALDRRRDSYRQRMMAALRDVALELQENALLSDEMVLNVAFLLERAREEEFEARVRELDQLFQDEITFRLIGPLPPYSFSTLEVVRPDVKKLAEARELLGLGLEVSVEEVRQAYRTLAARSHPDVNPDDPLAEERVMAFREASTLLLAYCQSQSLQGGGHGNGRTSLSPEALPPFLISIKGAASSSGPQRATMGSQ